MVTNTLLNLHTYIELGDKKIYRQLHVVSELLKQEKQLTG